MDWYHSRAEGEPDSKQTRALCICFHLGVLPVGITSFCHFRDLAKTAPSFAMFDSLTIYLDHTPS